MRHPYEWPTLAESHWPGIGRELTLLYYRPLQGHPVQEWMLKVYPIHSSTSLRTHLSPPLKKLRRARATGWPKNFLSGYPVRRVRLVESPRQGQTHSRDGRVATHEHQPHARRIVLLKPQQRLLNLLPDCTPGCRCVARRLNNSDPQSR